MRDDNDHDHLTRRDALLLIVLIFLGAAALLWYLGRGGW